LKFQLLKKFKKARASNMTLPHGMVKLPVYMPVGTKGSIKGLTSEEVSGLDCWLLLGNTYHLNNSPGSDFLGLIGGLRKFMNWGRNILTDSGGF
jgi:queuine tRNA-ribosyltransferase